LKNLPKHPLSGQTKYKVSQEKNTYAKFITEIQRT